MPLLTIDWKPPTNLTDHAGNVIPQDRVFYVSPPSEIGEILSADSTFKKGGKPRKIDWSGISTGIITALFCGFAVGGVVWVIIFLIMVNLSIRESSLLTWIPLSVGAVVAIFALRLFSATKMAVCTFVGTNGVARSVWHDNPQQRLPEVFRFDKATGLRIYRLARYVNRAYQETTYNFNWTDGNDQRVFFIGGQYKHPDDTPPPNDLYHFGLAAENTWTAFALQRAMEELNRNGTVKFSLKGKDVIVIGKGFVEIHQKGDVTRLNYEEIDNLIINQGNIELKRKGAKAGILGIGAKGIFNFKYDDLANAKQFFILFNSLVFES